MTSKITKGIIDKLQKDFKDRQSSPVAKAETPIEEIISQESTSQDTQQQPDKSVNERLLEILKSKSGGVESDSSAIRMLDNMIINDRQVSPLMRQIFQHIKESYSTPESRPNTIKIGETDFQYFQDLSTGLYGHYENDNAILLFIHGADDRRLNIIAIRQFLKPNTLDDDVQDFCKKYSSIRRTGKRVFLFGHSLAYYLSASCREFFSDSQTTGLFIAGYAPNSVSPIMVGMANEPKVKKLVFNNDWLATNVLETPSQRNVMVFKPYNAKTRLYGHGIGSYLSSPDTLNKNLIKTIP